MGAGLICKVVLKKIGSCILGNAGGFALSKLDCHHLYPSSRQQPSNLDLIELSIVIPYIFDVLLLAGPSLPKIEEAPRVVNDAGARARVVLHQPADILNHMDAILHRVATMTLGDL